MSHKKINFQWNVIRLYNIVRIELENRWQTNEKNKAMSNRHPKRTKEDSLGVAKPLPPTLFFSFFVTKLGPSPSWKLYEISTSQILGNVICPFQLHGA